MTVFVQLSTEVMTVGVEVNEHQIIVKGPPIVRKFVGLPLENLVRWMSRQPDLRMYRSSEEDS